MLRRSRDARRGDWSTGGDAGGRSWRPRFGALLAQVVTPGWVAMNLVVVVVAMIVAGGSHSPDERVALRPLGETDLGICSLRFGAGGPWLATHHPDHRLVIWDVDAARRHGTLEGRQARIVSFAFAPEGPLLAWGQSDGTVVLWDLSRWNQLERLDAGSAEVVSLAFAPDGRTLASGDSGGRLMLWEVSSGRLLEQEQLDCDRVNALAFSPDGGRLAWIGGVGRRARVEVRDLAGGGPPRILAGHPALTSLVSSLDFLPDGEGVVWLDRQKGRVRFWHLAEDHSEAPFRFEVHALDLVGLGPDGLGMALRRSDGQVEVWHRQPGSIRKVGRVQVPRVMGSCVALESRGNLLALGGAEGIVSLWESASSPLEPID